MQAPYGRRQAGRLSSGLAAQPALRHIHHIARARRPPGPFPTILYTGAGKHVAGDKEE